MSHFSSIGFPLKSREEMESLVEELFDKTERFSTSKGDYCLYKEESGAEL